MATVTEMREWLRANGHDVPDRGRLNPTYVAAYEAAQGDDDMPPVGITDDEPFVPAADELEPPPPPMKEETRPRTARQSRQDTRQSARARRGGLIGRLIDPPADTKAKGRGKKAAGHARVSWEKLITGMYTRAGQMVQSVAPATGRCLQAQAAMAGVMLEDVARGSVVDRMLQPAARAEAKLDRVFALAAPPLLVLALETTDPDDAMRRAMLTGLLRESLSISIEVTDSYADRIREQLERHAETEAKVDELISLIFGIPQAQAEDADPAMAGAAA